MAVELVLWWSAARKLSFSVPVSLERKAMVELGCAVVAVGPLLAGLEVYLGVAEVEDGFSGGCVVAADEEFTVGVVDVVGGRGAFGELDRPAFGVPLQGLGGG